MKYAKISLALSILIVVLCFIAIIYSSITDYTPSRADYIAASFSRLIISLALLSVSVEIYRVEKKGTNDDKEDE